MEFRKKMSEENPAKINLSKVGKDGELAVPSSEVLKSLNLLTAPDAGSIRPDQRTISHQLFTDKQDAIWDEKIGVRVTLERKITNLPSIFLVNSPHSGTHFFANRFNALSYLKMSLADYQYLDRSKFTEFSTGGYYAQKHLDPNIYNRTMLQFLLRNEKIVLHFRDPRSVLVSALFLMFKKQTPIEVHIDSLRWGSEPIPVDFINWDIKKKVDFYLENYYKTRCLNFVNKWFQFSESLPNSLGDNILISDFSLLRKDSKALFRGLIDFLELDSKKLAKLPKKFWEKSYSNNHFRKGLLDEWKEVCSAKQIKVMSDLIHDDCYSFFGWEYG